MHLTLRYTYLMVCVLALAACSSAPTPEPSPPAEPVVAIKPAVIKYVQPKSVSAKHSWAQKLHLHAHVHEALLALPDMESMDDRTVPVAIVESQSYQLLMGGGKDVAEYQQMLSAYSTMNNSPMATWHNEAALSQFSLLLGWQVAGLINQRDLDYELLQKMVKNYLVEDLASFPFAYELAVSIAHDEPAQTSLLIIDGATDPQNSAELQARLLTALHDLSVAHDTPLGLYSGEFIRPALVARNGPLVRFLLRPLQ